MLNTVRAKYQNGVVKFEEDIPPEISSATVLVTFLHEPEISLEGFPSRTDTEIMERNKKADESINSGRIFSTDQVIEALRL